LNPLQSGYRSTTALNADLVLIEEAIDNTLSRDGTAPNQMEAALDLNDNRIINVGEPVDETDAARLTDIQPALDLVTTLGDLQGYVDDAEAAADEATSIITQAALKANNLSDLASAATARTNLGLGTMALQDASDVDVTGGIIALGTDATTGLAPLRVGTYDQTSTDSGIVISRDMFDASTENGHGFVEKSLYRRSGGVAFAAFDAVTEMVGNSYDHYAGFQSRPRYLAGSSGQTMTDLYGFFDLPSIDTGTATDRFGAYVAAPTLTNGGAITNQYAFYAEDLTAGTNNWLIYTPGTMTSQLGDRVIVGQYGATSTDPGVVISRDMNDSSTTAGHGFVERTYFRRPGSNAFAAFDAYTTMAGQPYDHWAGFQDRPSYLAASAGQTMIDMYGYFTLPTIDTGTVTNRYGAYVAAPILASGAVITNQYAYYAESLTTGGTNWAFYSAGTTPSYFGGPVTLNGGITGQVAAALGSAAAPTYSFTGDLDVGMWSPSANVLAFSTSGTEAIRVFSTRNVSIGNTTDTDKLSVTGDIRASNRFYGTGTTAYVKLDDSLGAQLAYGTAVLNVGGPMILYGAGTERFRVSQTSGDVTAKGWVQALSATAIPAGGTAGAGIKMFSTSNFGVFGGSGAPTLAAAKGSLYLRSDGSGTSDRMYVNTDGSTTWTAVTTAA